MPILILAAVVLFIFFESQRSSSAPAVNTKPVAKPSTEAAIGGAIGAGACIAGGAYAGGAAGAKLGAQLAPVCSAIGAYVAPYVVEGAKKVGEGAAFAAKETAKGAVAVVGGAKSVINSVGSNPANLVLQPWKTGINVANSAASTLDRGATKLFNASPPALKIVEAPAVATIKVAAKATNLVSKPAAAVVGGLQSGTKAATSAVSSGVKKVLGFL
jgi:hypothetical protein